MTEKSDDDVALPPTAAPVGAAAHEPAPAEQNRPRVVPGPLAIALGYLIACIAVAAIATVVVGWGASRDVWGYVWAIVVTAFYAAGLGLFTTLPTALVLGWCLRRVRSQGLHVLAFFLVPLLLSWIIIGVTVHAVAVPLLIGTAIGLSMAAGRAAIWRLTRA